MKFGNGWIISSYTFLVIHLLSKMNAYHCYQKGPLMDYFTEGSEFLLWFMTRDILLSWKTINLIIKLLHSMRAQYMLFFYLFVFSISLFYITYVLLSYIIHEVLTLVNSVISMTHGVPSVNYSEMWWMFCNLLRHIIVHGINSRKKIILRYVDKVNCIISMHRLQNASYTWAIVSIVIIMTDLWIPRKDSIMIRTVYTEITMI